MKHHKKLEVLILYVEVLALICVVVFAIINPREKVVSKDMQQMMEEMSHQPIAMPEEDSEEDDETVNRYHYEISDEAQAKLAEMTLEEKVAQMYIVRPEQLMDIRRVVVAGNKTKLMIDQYPVGGFVYSELNFEDEEQTKKLITGVNQLGMDRVGIPMYLAIQEVGGEEASPMAKLLGYEIQKYAIELADTQDETQVRNTAGYIADYLKQTGINMNLSTVVDLATANETAADMICYGKDAEVAKTLALASMETYEEKGISTVVKYFPERNSAVVDTETESLVATKNIEEHLETDFYVCQGAINMGAKAVMLSNVTDSSVSKEAVPASLSKDAVNYLRDTMGFEGIIITDSLAETYVSGNYTVEEATVKAFNAGVDVIYDPVDFVKSYNALLTAIQNGDIDESEVDKRVGRILTLKLASIE